MSGQALTRALPVTVPVNSYTLYTLLVPHRPFEGHGRLLRRRKASCTCQKCSTHPTP